MMHRKYGTGKSNKIVAGKKKQQHGGGGVRKCNSAELCCVGRYDNMDDFINFTVKEKKKILSV